VPLVLEEGHWITTLSGTTLNAEVIAQTAGGKRLASFANSTLCTHFGLSGPSVLDASRYHSAEKLAAGDARLVVCWVPGRTPDEVDALLSDAQRRGEKRSAARFLSESFELPARFAEALCDASGVGPGSAVHTLTKAQRRALATNAAAMPAPVVRDRGFTHAEVTAGGVPLGEVILQSMESRVRPGLHLAGEILDVDGRIGGFNFQWAWASGYLAGRGAAEALAGR
jgi:predicted Rossmann fold flavoprotein